MPTNLEEQAKSFTTGQLAQFTPAEMPTSSTTLLPGFRSVAQQNAPVAIGNGTSSLYRGLDSVRSNVDRINALFTADMTARQKAKESSQLGTGGGNYDPKYGDLGLAGQAYENDGSLSNSRNKLLRNASSYIGSPYVLGGTTKQGIDCSGLVMSVYNKMGFNVSQHSATWQGRNIPGVRTAVSNLRPGDLVAWKDGSHIAIYAGNGQIIEAANTRVGTVKRKLWADPSDVVGIAVKLPGESIGKNPGVSGKKATRSTARGIQ